MTARDPASSPMLRLVDVSRQFDSGNIVALRDVSLDLDPGDLIAITGPSGSGKTTLLNIMAGLDRPTSGSVTFAGITSPTAAAWTRLRATRMGVVFQEFNLLPTLNAVENVEVAMFGVVPSAALRRRRALERLEEVAVAYCAQRRPAELSAGERRRVGIARSLANDPDLLLADEPTSNLDTVTAAAVLDLLFRLRSRRDMAMAIVTHDPAVIARCPCCLHIVDGRVVAVGADAARARIV